MTLPRPYCAWPEGCTCTPLHSWGWTPAECSHLGPSPPRQAGRPASWGGCWVTLRYCRGCRGTSVGAGTASATYGSHLHTVITQYRLQETQHNYLFQAHWYGPATISWNFNKVVTGSFMKNGYSFRAVLLIGWFNHC